MALTPPEGEAVVVERVDTPRGELVLRRAGGHFEVISNGTFLMDTRNGESERLLVRAALARAERARSILIGGLGVGFSLTEALNDERVARVRVIEIEPTIVSWHDRYLGHITGEARVDERSEIVIGDYFRSSTTVLPMRTGVPTAMGVGATTRWLPR